MKLSHKEKILIKRSICQSLLAGIITFMFSTICMFAMMYIGVDAVDAIFIAVLICFITYFAILSLIEKYKSPDAWLSKQGNIKNGGLSKSLSTLYIEETENAREDYEGDIKD